MNRPASPSSAEGSPAPSPRRRKAGPFRWLLRGLIVVLLLIIAVTGAAPWLLSQPQVRTRVVDAANDWLSGKIEVQEFSLAWFAPLRIAGLKVRDAQQREVFAVREIRNSTGLFSTLTGGLNFGQIDIDAAQIALIQQPDGSYSLAEALAPKGATKTGGSGDSGASPQAGGADAKPLDIRGRLVIKDASITVQQNNGRQVAAPDIDVDLNIQTLNEINGTLQAQLTDIGEIKGDITLKQLAAGGKIDPQQATGSAKLTSTPLQLGPLGALADQDLAGVATLDVLASFGDKSASATIKADLKGVQSKQGPAAQAKPLDAALKSDINLANNVLALVADLASSAGTAKADLKYTLGEQAVDAQKLIGAVLTGESITLPEFVLNAAANLDLAAVDQAVPGLLKVREGQQITRGKLDISKLNVRGGKEPAAVGMIDLKEVATSGAQAVQLSPISLSFDSELQPGQGLFVKNLELKSAFAELTGKGMLKNVSAGFRADLSKLEAELGRVFDLGVKGLSGTLSGTLTAAQPSAERVDLKLQTTAEQVRFIAGDKTFDVAKASLRQAGYLTLQQQKPEKYVADEAVIDVNNEIVASAKGAYDLQSAAFSADVNAQQINLSFLAKQAAALGLGELARYSGAFSGALKAEQAGRDKPIVTSGALKGQSLAVDGKPLAGGAVTLTWSGTEIEPTAGGVRVAAAKVESAIANLAASDVKLATKGAFTFTGKVDGSADLGPVFNTVGAVAKMEKPPAINGKLTLNTTGQSDGDAVSVSGTANIDQLSIGEGAAAVKDQKLALEYDAKLDTKASSINLSKFKLASTPLSAEITGSVNRYSSAAELALNGRYEASWPELTRLLHEMAPSTRTLLEVSGKSASALTAQGAANQPGAQPAFRGLTSGAEVKWDGAKIYGVGLGPATLAPKLANGQLTLPNTSITAADGKVNLGGMLDFQPADPTVRIPGQLNVLEGVALSNVLAEALLSYFNPIFMSVVNIEGRINLNVNDIVLPLGETMKSAANGKGRLDLQTVKMQAGGPMMELLALGGVVAANAYSVQFSAVDFVVKDGRVVYDNFKMLFPPDFDLIFRGSVGFDSTLDLVVSVPVRPDMFQKLGIQGPSSELSKQLAGARIEIPIAGTRESPKLDFAKVDTSKLLQGAMQNTLQGALQDPGKAAGDIMKGDGLKGLLGGGDKGGAAPPTGGEKSGAGQGKDAPPADKKSEKQKKPDEPKPAPSSPVDDLLKKLPGSKPK